MSDQKKKVYKVALSENEVSILWLLSTIATGTGPYKEFFDDIYKKTYPFVTSRIDKDLPDNYINGQIQFNGKTL